MKKQDTSKNVLPDQNQGNPVIISDDEGSPKPSPRENGSSRRRSTTHSVDEATSDEEMRDHLASPEFEEAGSLN